MHNPAGHAGAWIADLMLYIFGFSAWWWIVLLGMSVWWGFRKLNTLGKAGQASAVHRTGWVCVLLVASSALEALRFYTLKVDLPLAPGGVLGIEVSRFLAQQFGYTGSTLFLLALMAAGWSIFSGMSWLWAFERLGALWNQSSASFMVESMPGVTEKLAVKWRSSVKWWSRRRSAGSSCTIRSLSKPPTRSAGLEKSRGPGRAGEADCRFSLKRSSGGRLPPLHLLDPAPPATETVSAETLEYTSRLIERKLADFGVQVKVLAAMPGPVITRYEIEPAVGVKGAQIVNLARDLARALAMVSIRVVETVPGKSCMALELPNPSGRWSSCPRSFPASPTTT
jgi:S-DNA-T family DNA segregation ATPase FtsK/SpoIIIE